MPRVSDQVSCQNPKVSVVMITYNHEKFLGQAIEGVLMQETGFPVELVIGEDCSTDGTRRIALEYATKYPNVGRVLQPVRNLGVSRNLAATLAACRGGYVAMCEGDDYWIHPDKLQKQVSFLDANPAYVMCCHRERVFYEVTQEMKDMIPWLDLRDTYELQDVLG